MATPLYPTVAQAALGDVGSPSESLVMVLPEDTGQEALNFVRFLYERRQRSQVHPSAGGAARASTALLQQPERSAGVNANRR